MGIIGSLIIHTIFLFLSSYIHIGKVSQEKERIIEVSLISIPQTPKKEEIFIPKRDIPKKIISKGAIIPSVMSKSFPLRWQPKMVIPKELPGKKGEESEGLKLDMTNIYGEVKVGGGEAVETGKGGDIEGGEKGAYTLEITGEVARRTIFYQEGFDLPEWFERKGISVDGMFKFWVLADGSVDRVSIEHSFGYRELDSLAMNAILRWRFCPLEKGIYEEWGIAKIKIKLK